MQEGRAQGLEYHYELFDLDLVEGGQHALAKLLESAQGRGFAGLNVTHPSKQAILPLLDELSDDASALGAVNTVVFSKGLRIGHNTDWWGFAESFRRRLNDASVDSVLQLGAGGAGAAVGYAMLKSGARALGIYDIDANRMNGLVSRLAALFPSQQVTAETDLGAAMSRANGLVHATTTGMAKQPGLPLSADLLSAKHWVAEIVYFPLETQLLRTARAIGCRTLDGGGMLIYQAARGFELFTGIAPDVNRMIRHFDLLTHRPVATAAAE